MKRLALLFLITTSLTALPTLVSAEDSKPEGDQVGLPVVEAPKVEEKTRSCQQIQQALEQRLSGVNQLTTKQLEFLNSSSERLQNLIKHQQINITDGAEDKASQAKTKATAALNSLKHSELKITCKEGDKLKVNDHKQKVRTAVTALKDFRQALRDLIRSAKQAAEAGQ